MYSCFWVCDIDCKLGDCYACAFLACCLDSIILPYPAPVLILSTQTPAVSSHQNVCSPGQYSLLVAICHPILPPKPIKPPPSPRHLLGTRPTTRNCYFRLPLRPTLHQLHQLPSYVIRPIPPPFSLPPECGNLSKGLCLSLLGLLVPASTRLS